MKSIKEKQLLVKWSKAMNEPIDDGLVEEVARYERLQRDIIESVKSNSIKDLAEASVVADQVVKHVLSYPKPPTLDELMGVLQEEQHELVQAQTPQKSSDEKAVPPTLAQRTAEHITQEVKLEEKADSFQQPDAELTGRSVNDIRRKLKYLEDWLAKEEQS